MPIALRSALAASAFALLLPSCTQTLTITYSGNNPVRYPWRTCGMGCEQAFTELQANRDATGQACEDLIAKGASLEGADPWVSAAVLYDSALLLVIRGKSAEAYDRFAKAEALDPDPEYKRLEQQVRDSAVRFNAP
jgi:hypothetical protein